MPQRAQNTPICRDCHGFATAAITTGARAADGTRATLIVDCRACNGTGHAKPASVVAGTGR
ncbi:hypothetical protein ACFZBP_14305 [Streptomyces sp. NPDC008086]|uniref:hypothetical protein n=1 Tax=Streptomyces sp. NPDC008086 TaxID=3364807 RepID=UPI0036ED054C